jgi:DNA-binding transcriptional ArsR family regulator
MKIREALTALSALAQETRLSIFRLLVESGPDGISAGRIGDMLKVPAATLSFHLKELAHAGLISSRQDKQFIYYAANYEEIANVMTFLTQNCCQGMPQACLSSVETALSRCCPPRSANRPKSKGVRRETLSRTRRR